MAAAAPKLSHVRKGLDLVKLKAVDDTGALEVTFFNQSFINLRHAPKTGNAQSGL
jgi:ATP-dependent DNA helicase RecG